MRARLVLVAWLACATAHATASYVYHEQTTNLTGGACGNYLTTPAPGPSDSYPLEWKIEYQFYTDTTAVYYTTDGTTPVGAFGVPVGTTQTASGVYGCTFTFGNATIDVAHATLPAQPAGTVVKYIIGAWHSGLNAGPEVFANSSNCNDAGCATVFSYTVATPPDLSMATGPDLPMGLPDLAPLDDLSTAPPDLSTAPPDLSTASDLSSTASDLSSTDDLSAAPDLSPAFDDGVPLLDGSAPPDLARADAARSDGGTAPDLRMSMAGGTTGCSCALGGRPRSALPLAAFALLALALLRRRRS